MSRLIKNTFDDVFAASWLQGISADVVEQLRRISNTIHYQNGDVVYAMGGPQDYLWGVKAGQLRVEVAMNEMEPVLGHIHHAGAWLGESEVLLGLPGLVEMRAIGDISMTRVKYNHFSILADKHPALWTGLARLTSFNQLLAMSAANDLVLRTSRQRLAATLLRLTGHRGVFQACATTESVLVTQSELANLTNLALSKTSDHLREMSKDGLIGLEYRRIVLRDFNGLGAIISGKEN